VSIWGSDSDDVLRTPISAYGPLYHSENGVIGYGPVAAEDTEDPNLVMPVDKM